MRETGNSELNSKSSRDSGSPRSCHRALLVQGPVRCGVAGGNNVVAKVATQAEMNVIFVITLKEFLTTFIIEISGFDKIFFG